MNGVSGQRARQRQRFETVEARQRMVRNDQIEAPRLDRVDVVGLVVDQRDRAVEAIVGERARDELGVGR